MEIEILLYIFRVFGQQKDCFYGKKVLTLLNEQYIYLNQQRNPNRLEIIGHLAEAWPSLD